MSGQTAGFRTPRFAIAAVAASLGLIAWIGAPTPASAFIVGFGFPYPGFYAAPWPYYPPPAYYPYYPPASYYPPAPAYYPPPQAAAPAATNTAAITYTSRPAFKNAAGQTCREYRIASGALGTACQDARGQWRVAN